MYASSDVSIVMTMFFKLFCGNSDIYLSKNSSKNIIITRGCIVGKQENDLSSIRLLRSTINL